MLLCSSGEAAFHQSRAVPACEGLWGCERRDFPDQTDGCGVWQRECLRGKFSAVNTARPQATSR